MLRTESEKNLCPCTVAGKVDLSPDDGHGQMAQVQTDRRENASRGRVSNLAQLLGDGSGRQADGEERDDSSGSVSTYMNLRALKKEERDGGRTLPRSFLHAGESVHRGHDCKGGTHGQTVSEARAVNSHQLPAPALARFAQADLVVSNAALGLATCVLSVANCKF